MVPFSKPRRTAVIGVVLVVALAAILAWWVSSPWFIRSSNLKINGTNVSSVVSSPEERVYFGVPITNTSNKKLMIEEIKFATLKNSLYTFDIIPVEPDPTLGINGSAETLAHVGTARLDDLESQYANQWAQRQSPRGVWLETDEEYTLLIGLGTRDNFNHVGTIDVVFTDGRFSGTTSAATNFQVTFEP